MGKIYTIKRLGILNAQGNIWTPSTFDTDEQARSYLDAYSLQFKPPIDLSKHSVVPVRVTISVVKS